VNPTQGYNVLLKEKEPPEGFAKMSIIEFLREIRRGQELPKRVAIYGLEGLLLTNKDSRAGTKFIRNMFRENNRLFREKGYTFLFVPRKELYVNRDVYLKAEDKKAIVSSLFGLRLQIKEVGLYHADFEF
jgi:hypothetical protein